MQTLTQIFRDVCSYRELLLALTMRDIKIKYKQAALGAAWVFFMPALAIVTGVMFRVAMAYFAGRPLVLADITGVMVKSLPWLLFASIVGGASNSLVGNSALITKIYFPREVVPLSGVLSSLFDFSISLLGLILLLSGLSLVAVDRPISLTPWLLLVPLFWLVLVIMATGLGLLLAAANMFFRDVKYIVQVVLQFGIFFSLVYFKYTELGSWGWVLLINPVAPLLEATRMATIQGTLDPFLWPWLAYSALFALVILWVSSIVFERAEYLFAEYA